MLFGQHRRRRQHGHLLAVVHGLEGGAHGQLRLAITHVAADEPVHWPRLTHVCFDFRQRRQLVRRLGVWKRRLELRLPIGIGWKGETRLGFTQCLQRNHLARQVEDGGLHLVLTMLPTRAAQFRQLRIAFAAADVFLD